MNNLTSALQDAVSAIALDASRPEAHLVQGIAHFKQGEVPQAKESFQNAHERSTGTLQAVVQTWLRKADAELNNRNFQSSTIKKIPKPVVDETKPVVVSAPVSEVRATSGKIAYTWF